MKTGIVIFAHGSPVESANDQVRAVAGELARQGGYDIVETGFLDYPPKLREAVDKAVARGASRVLVVPYFLTLGLHVRRDLPRIIDELRGVHPGVDILATPADGRASGARLHPARPHARGAKGLRARLLGWSELAPEIPPLPL